MSSGYSATDNQAIQIEAMDLYACDLAGKLDRLKDVAEENSILLM